MFSGNVASERQSFDFSNKCYLKLSIWSIQKLQEVISSKTISSSLHAHGTNF
jgi:hypothetical protein